VLRKAFEDTEQPVKVLSSFVYMMVSFAHRDALFLHSAITDVTNYGKIVVDVSTSLRSSPVIAASQLSQPIALLSV